MPFEQLADAGADFKSLDAKLRAALTKFTVGEAANKHRDLVDEIQARTDEMK